MSLPTYVERLEQQAAFWDRTKLSLGIIWWWLQGAQYCAEGEEWEALNNLQQIVAQIEEGTREAK